MDITFIYLQDMQEFLQRYKKIFIKNIKIIFDSLNKFLTL